MMWRTEHIQSPPTNSTNHNQTNNILNSPGQVNPSSPNYNRSHHYNNRNENHNNKNENSNYNNKPTHINEKSYQISTENEYGEVRIEEKSVHHDGFEVYHSTSYKKKQKRIERNKRLEKLKNRNARKDLMAAKRPIGTRFVLTNADLEITDEDVEEYIYDHFKWVDDVYVRKCQLKHSKWSSFVFIIYDDEEVDRRIFEEHTWPGRIRCFFEPPKKRYYN